MSATAARRRPREPEPVVADRGASSMAMLVERVRAVGRAWASGDESATKVELEALAAEAALLARMEPLPLPDGRVRRLRIAAARAGLD